MIRLLRSKGLKLDQRPSWSDLENWCILFIDVWMYHVFTYISDGILVLVNEGVPPVQHVGLQVQGCRREPSRGKQGSLGPQGHPHLSSWIKIFMTFYRLLLFSWQSLNLFIFIIDNIIIFCHCNLSKTV